MSPRADTPAQCLNPARARPPAPAYTRQVLAISVEV